MPVGEQTGQFISVLTVRVDAELLDIGEEVHLDPARMSSRRRWLLVWFGF